MQRRSWFSREDSALWTSFFETLTLVQTKKLDKRLPVFLYGRDFWDGLINFEQFVEWGVISPSDLDLFKKVDGVDEAFPSNYRISDRLNRERTAAQSGFNPSRTT